MKKIVLVLSTLLPLSKAVAQSFGTFASAVFMSQDGVAMTYNTSGSNSNLIGTAGLNFNGDLGSYHQQSGALILKGGEVKTYKDNSANVCGATMYYSIRLASDTPVFNALTLPYKAGCDGGVFTDGLGPCSGNDQKWSTQTDSVDLTVYMPGDYAIDVYFEIPGSSNSSTFCDESSYVGTALSFAGTMTFSIINNVLPVQLISFTGTTSGERNILKWAMAAEANVAAYHLEKSVNGGHFQPIVTVPVHPELKGNYTFEDASGSKDFYRLKMIGKNKQVTYSDIVMLNRTKETSVAVMPNPAKDIINVISATPEKATISLFDITGKKIKNIVTSSAQTKIDLSGLPNGHYIVDYKSARTSRSIKIEKQ